MATPAGPGGSEDAEVLSPQRRPPPDAPTHPHPPCPDPSALPAQPPLPSLPVSGRAAGGGRPLEVYINPRKPAVYANNKPAVHVNTKRIAQVVAKPASRQSERLAAKPANDGHVFMVDCPTLLDDDDDDDDDEQERHPPLPLPLPPQRQQPSLQQSEQLHPPPGAF